MTKNTGKPKIATIAFHRAINYGALLQVYALQKKIDELGGECTILDYRNDLLESRHKMMKLSDCKTGKEYIRYIFLSHNYNKKYKAFREFSSRYLNLSKPYLNLEELQKDSIYYDKFITGSDQVWNHTITNNDRTFFLDFLDDISKKNSYAASFGFEEIPQELVGSFRDMLKDYNQMSVREMQGAEIIKHLLNKEIPVVLDPTLLVSKEEWHVISDPYTKHNDYILVYGFSGSNRLVDFAYDLSKKTGCKIIQIANPYFKKANVRYERAASPERFLGLIENAKYIVTNSFHGTAFSINLNKQFFVELLPPPETVNSRLEHILDTFDLRSRQIIDGKNNSIFSDINYWS